MYIIVWCVLYSFTHTVYFINHIAHIYLQIFIYILQFYIILSPSYIVLNFINTVYLIRTIWLTYIYFIALIILASCTYVVYRRVLYLPLLDFNPQKRFNLFLNSKCDGRSRKIEQITVFSGLVHWHLFTCSHEPTPTDNKATTHELSLELFMKSCDGAKQQASVLSCQWACAVYQTALPCFYESSSQSTWNCAVFICRLTNIWIYESIYFSVCMAATDKEDFSHKGKVPLTALPQHGGSCSFLWTQQGRGRGTKGPRGLATDVYVSMVQVRLRLARVPFQCRTHADLREDTIF